jgi:hypothetical protein
VDAAIAAEDMFHGSSLAPSSATMVRNLAALEARTLAVMHGPSFQGDCARALGRLADDFAARLDRARQPSA